MTYWASIENGPKVVGLKQVISGEDHKPYAVKTHLGWSIVGSITREVTGFCHCISVKHLPAITPASGIKPVVDTNKVFLQFTFFKYLYFVRVF